MSDSGGPASEKTLHLDCPYRYGTGCACDGCCSCVERHEAPMPEKMPERETAFNCFTCPKVLLPPGSVVVDKERLEAVLTISSLWMPTTGKRIKHINSDEAISYLTALLSRLEGESDG